MKAVLCAGMWLIAAATSAQGPILYFKTTDYAAFMCENARMASRANFISHGFSPTMDPVADHKWLQTQVDAKKCQLLSPEVRFLASAAEATYLGDYGIEWVTGVIAPQAPDKPPLGFVPIQYTQFIPIPRL